MAFGYSARSQEAWRAGRNSRKITALQLDFPLPYTTNAIKASYKQRMAHAELHVVWSKHHMLKESIAGCLDQRSDLDSSAWV